MFLEYYGLNEIPIVFAWTLTSHMCTYQIVVEIIEVVLLMYFRYYSSISPCSYFVNQRLLKIEDIFMMTSSRLNGSCISLVVMFAIMSWVESQEYKYTSPSTNLSFKLTTFCTVSSSLSVWMTLLTPELTLSL